jgi:hypothetical protein
MKRLNEWERKILGRIYGPLIEQGSWKTRSNQELCELYKDLDIVTDIKNKRLKWVAHVVRMDQGRVHKTVF